MLRKAFQMFDTTKCGYIDVLKISTILNTMGQLFDDAELQALISQNDPESIYFFEFEYAMYFKMRHNLMKQNMLFLIIIDLYVCERILYSRSLNL